MDALADSVNLLMGAKRRDVDVARETYHYVIQIVLVSDSSSVRITCYHRCTSPRLQGLLSSTKQQQFSLYKRHWQKEIIEEQCNNCAATKYTCNSILTDLCRMIPIHHHYAVPRYVMNTAKFKSRGERDTHPERHVKRTPIHRFSWNQAEKS